MTYWKRIDVLLTPGSPFCAIEIENINNTETGEHKVKVSSAMISLDAGAFVDSFF